LELLAVYRQFLAGAGGAAVSSVWYKYTFCCRAEWPAAGSWRATYRNYRLPGAAGWCMKKYSLTRFYYLKPAAPRRAFQAAALCTRPAGMGSVLFPRRDPVTIQGILTFLPATDSSGKAAATACENRLPHLR